MKTTSPSPTFHRRGAGSLRVASTSVLLAVFVAFLASFSTVAGREVALYHIMFPTSEEDNVPFPHENQVIDHRATVDIAAASASELRAALTTKADPRLPFDVREQFPPMTSPQGEKKSPQVFKKKKKSMAPPPLHKMMVKRKAAMVVKQPKLRKLSMTTGGANVVVPKQQMGRRYLMAASGQVTNKKVQPSVAGAVQNNDDPGASYTPFDFIVAGFPKCGTTTLLKTFASHDQISMAATEQCAIASPGQADAVVVRKLEETAATLAAPSALRAFKCPNSLYTHKSFERLRQHSPDAKLVVGIRHPVSMLQSFYNYRVTELYEKGLADQESIPAFADIVAADQPWKHVSLASVRFDLFLMQLGKTAVSASDLDQLRALSLHYDVAVTPSNYTVFLYTVDQLEDVNVTRSNMFRQTLQDYLGLSEPLPPMGHENKNHATGEAGHAETIDICDDQWTSVRAEVTKVAVQSAQWIKQHFVASKDVVVANPGHFVETLQTWGIDPCDSKNNDEDAVLDTAPVASA